MIYEPYVRKKEIVMDKFGEKIKETLNETVNGFEVSEEIKERIAEKIKQVENDMSLEKAVK